MTTPTSTYASARDEFLHELAVVGYASRTGGARTSPQGKFWVLHISFVELASIHGQYPQFIDARGVNANDLAGYFIVTERTRPGSVTPEVFVETFDKSFQADDQFDHWDKQYAAYLAEDAAAASLVAQLRFGNGLWSVVVFYHGEYYQFETDDPTKPDLRDAVPFPSLDDATRYAMQRAGFGELHNYARLNESLAEAEDLLLPSAA